MITVPKLTPVKPETELSYLLAHTAEANQISSIKSRCTKLVPWKLSILFWHVLPKCRRFVTDQLIRSMCYELVERGWICALQYFLRRGVFEF